MKRLMPFISVCVNNVWFLVGLGQGNQLCFLSKHSLNNFSVPCFVLDLVSHSVIWQRPLKLWNKSLMFKIIISNLHALTLFMELAQKTWNISIAFQKAHVLNSSEERDQNAIFLLMWYKRICGVQGHSLFPRYCLHKFSWLNTYLS